MEVPMLRLRNESLSWFLIGKSSLFPNCLKGKIPLTAQPVIGMTTPTPNTAIVSLFPPPKNMTYATNHDWLFR